VRFRSECLFSRSFLVVTLFIVTPIRRICPEYVRVASKHSTMWRFLVHCKKLMFLNYQARDVR